MKGMKNRGLVIIIASALSLSSCSWVQRHAHWPSMPKMPKMPDYLNPFKWGKSKKEKPKQPETQRTGQTAALPLAPRKTTPDPAKIQPTEAQQAKARQFIADQHAREESIRRAREEAEARSEYRPQRTNGTNFGEPGPFIPRNAPELEMQQSGTSSPLAPQEPDAAVQRHLRSPELPKALPMDINGKIHSPSN